MALIDPCSSECAKSELELFDLPPTQTSIEETRIEPFYPLTSLDGNGPIEFRVNIGVDEYIDTNDTWIYTKMKILDKNGKAVPASVTVSGATSVPDESIVFPVNNFSASLFRQVEVMLNSTPLPTSSLYQYRGYLETLLSYGPDTKKYELQAGMWYDDNSNVETTNPIDAGETNKGAKSRFGLTQYSKAFECMGRIHHELFEQPKLLLNKVTLGVRFHRSDPNFALMSKKAGSQYRIEIEKATLLVTVKKVASHAREAIETRLLHSNAKYNLRKVELKFFTKGSERADVSVTNLCNGILPSQIIFGMVETDAFSGSVKKNPFNFQSFGVSEVGLQKNGVNIPFKLLNTDFEEKDEILMGYFQLLHTLGVWNKRSSIGLDMQKDFAAGKNLFAVNLTQDFSYGGHLNLLQEGSISLTLRLKKGLNKSITVITYLVYPSTVLEINHQREIFVNE